jgi:Flp pilus assembly secretin CpaC
LGRVSISNPEIADIANADSEQILLLAKKSGQTVLFIWDEYGKRTIIIRVFDEDLNLVMERMRQLLDKSDLKEVNLEVNTLEGKVMATGKIPIEKKDDFENILDPFGGVLMNLIKIEAIEDLVQIDIQIAELNTSLSKAIGIDWTSAVTYKEDGNNFEVNRLTLFKTEISWVNF